MLRNKNVAALRLLLTLLLAPSLAPAQSPADGSASAGEIILVKAGRLLDAHSGRALDDQAILVEGERIREVGPAAEVAKHAPSLARLIDLSGFTVLPGLIDCHAHILGDLTDWSPGASLRMSSAQGALWGARNLRVWLSVGFTTLRDAGEADPYYGQLALRNSIRRGLIEGPRLVSAGGFVSLTGGHGDEDVLAPDQALLRRPNLADTVDEVERAVRRDIKYGADWIKLMATGGVMDPMSDYNVQELSDDQMARAVEVAHRAHKRVMAHAHGAPGIKAAVRAGVDSIEHGSILDEEGARLMAEKGTWLIPTFEIQEHAQAEGEKRGMDPYMIEKEKAVIKLHQAGFNRALQYHVKIAYGVDDQPEVVAREFGALVRAGLKPVEALQAATLSAAELLGMSADIGTLEAGKFADLVAVPGDPLSDVTVMEHVAFVMKGGEVFRDDRPAGRKIIRERPPRP